MGKGREVIGGKGGGVRRWRGMEDTKERGSVKAEKKHSLVHTHTHAHTHTRTHTHTHRREKTEKEKEREDKEEWK